MSIVRFRVSLVSLQKRLFATSVSNTVSLQSPYTNHLIDSYGLPPESAADISRILNLNDKKLAHCDSVVGVFKDYGFSDTQIAQLILKRPSTLTSRVGPLSGKLQFFQDNGFVGNHLTELILTSPTTLGMALGYNLKPSMDILKKVLGTEDKVVATVKCSTKVLSYTMCKNMQPNIDLMVAQGVLPGTITNLITRQPRTFLQRRERVVDAIDKVNTLAIKPSSPMFLHALRAVLSMSQANWVRKIEFLKSLELTEKDIVSVFTRYPLCLTLSEEKITASWNFFVNEVKCDRSTIIANPKFLMYGLEKRVRPRFNVFKTLKSMGLVSEKIKFSYVVQKTEKDFVKRFILPNQELLPHLMDINQSTSPAIAVKGKNKCSAPSTSKIDI
ncbi:hypothetical protein QQ045_024466 [Rhodiola kirilowii]